MPLLERHVDDFLNRELVKRNEEMNLIWWMVAQQKFVREHQCLLLTRLQSCFKFLKKETNDIEC